jgi:uncharacterized membrane protein
MFMDKIIEKIIFLAIAIAILFYSLAYAILPAFAPLYEHCGTNNPYSAGSGGTDLTNACCQTPSATIIACTNCNNSVGYSTFLSSCYSLIAKTNGTDCYQCASFGNKSIFQGLFFLMFLIIIFAIILVIIYASIKKKYR